MDRLTHKPLTPLQLGMISEHMKEPLPGLDVLQILCDAAEELSPEIFARAWDHVVRRHDLLRSRFLWQDVDLPVREEVESATVPFLQHDWRELSSREQLSRYEAFLTEDRKAGIDFTKAPLMRLSAFRLGRKRWRWCWTIHHLLLDVRGVKLVLEEVFAVYEALRFGGKMELAPAPAFGDYATWHQVQDWSGAEKWWRARLEGFVQPTALLADRGAGQDGMDIWAEHRTELSARVTRRLSALASKAGVTLNTVFQGAWALFLSRCSGEQDVVFGATRACRRSNVPRAPLTAGLFVNALPVRAYLDPAQDLVSWLRELRAQWVAMRDFENVPLSLVQGWSSVPRGVCLFETILNFQESSWHKALHAQGGAWRRRQFWLRSQPRYPLALDVHGGGGSLELNMVYDQRRFAHETISRMMGYFVTLLENMTPSAGLRVGDLEIMTGKERRQVVKKWNATARRYPRRGIHELFEERVKTAPDAVAATFGGHSITYHKLNLRANRLGRHLRAQGAGPGVMVAICAERSLDLIVGLLGILKAGAAYVPLDPEYPAERLIFMMQDTGAPLLLTQSHLASKLPVTQAKVVLLDTDWPEIKRQSSDGFSSGTGSNSPAYVIFTSGSTGTPKGVIVPHRAVVRLVVNTDYVHFSPGEVFLQIAPVSFDASTFELWGALLNGARVMVHPPGRFSMEELGAFIATHDVTTLFVTTALFEQLVEFHSESLSGVKQILTGGETMPVETMREALRNLPNSKIIHCYGPTENTTFTTCLHVKRVGGDATSIPIGKPIANTTVYILDTRLQPVPPGVPGELYTGGDGLALGYLNRPELTAERFVRHPFARRKDEMLYRTGDMARWTPDGIVDFIGRFDHQVKIRGHRIELGEIESVLSGHPDVRDAVVVARADSPGNKRLVAFLSVRRKLSIREIRRFLEGRLPAYMIPSVIVPLESLPLNANGKVDRRALPDLHALGGSDGEDAGRHVAPRSETEEIVAAIWSEALEIPFVGAHDHFFELGGHSLTAMSVVSRVNKALGKTLPVRLLFERPVLEAFCAAAQALTNHGDDEVSKPIEKVKRTGFLPASFFQERIWNNLLHRKEGDVLNHQMGWWLEGPLNVPALKRSLSEILRRYEVLRTGIRVQDGQAVQIIHPAADISLEIIPMKEAPEHQTELMNATVRIVHTPIDGDSGAMIRFVLMRWHSDLHLLLVVFHELVYDPSVRRILFRELEILYAGYCQGEEPQIAGPVLQYADFAIWQRRCLQEGSPGRRMLVDFWIETLGGGACPLVLPFDRNTSGAVQPDEGYYLGGFGRLSFAQIAAFARSHGVTVFMLLLACIKALLHRRTGQTDLLIGTYFAKQGRPELEEVMGPLTNLVPIRACLAGNPTFADLLARTRETVLAAQTHQDLPFEEIVTVLQTRGITPPVIDAIVMYTHLEESALDLPGLSSRFAALERKQMPWGFSVNFITLGTDAPVMTSTCSFDANRHDASKVRELMNGIPLLLDEVIENASLRLDGLARSD